MIKTCEKCKKKYSPKQVRDKYKNSSLFNSSTNNKNDQKAFDDLLSSYSECFCGVCLLFAYRKELKESLFGF